jgi:hypothetical protein
MKPKLLKNIYIFSMLGVSIMIIAPLSATMNWNFKWWYSILLYVIFSYIGKFLYVFFSGINVSDIQFFDTSSLKQEVILNYQLGFSEIFVLNGEFDNDIEIKEEDLRQLIYNQTTRYMLNDNIKFGKDTQIEYVYGNKKIKVLFKA